MLAGFGGGDVDERLEIRPVNDRLVRLSFELAGDAFKFLTVLVSKTVGSLELSPDGTEFRFESADPVGCTMFGGRAGLARSLEFGLQLLGVFAVLGGFGGGDVDEGLEVGGGGRGFFRVLRELCLKFGDAVAGCGFRAGGVFASVVSFGLRLLEFGSEPLECFGCAVGLGLPGSELGLELADPCVRGLVGGSASSLCVLEFGLELLGAVAVLGGLGGGDVDERLEVGGGACGFLGAAGELSLKLGDTFIG